MSITQFEGKLEAMSTEEPVEIVALVTIRTENLVNGLHGLRARIRPRNASPDAALKWANVDLVFY